jgi:hypothetical protein
MHLGKLVKIDLPPGLSRQGTLYQTQGRWYDSNFVRWYEGAMTPIGGWVKRITSALTGKPRAMIAWRGNDNVRYYAVGTQSKLYAATPSLTTMADITPAGFTSGYADAASGGGYGYGTYGTGTYGTPRTDTTAIAYEATMWSLDTFGQYLIGCTEDDGKLYKWTLDTGTAAAVVSGAPTCNGLVTTPEGFIFLLGADGDRRTVAWCDQRDETTWTPASTNQAGSYQVESPGRLLCGQRTRGVTLLFTDVDVFAATYIGLPYVYSIIRVGESCGAISKGCVVAPDSRAFWMHENAFFMWDGASVQPMKCDVFDAVFNDMNKTQRSKITASLNSLYSEAWWFYPSEASTENDRAVVYNYKEGHWTLHQISRLSMCDHGVFTYPMACSSDGYVYDHETGVSWGSDPYAESGPAEIGEGDRIMRVRRAIFDERTAGDVELTLYGRNWPNGTETTYGPYTSANPVSVRLSGRQVRMRVDFQGDGQFGAPRFDVAEGSKR